MDCVLNTINMKIVCLCRKEKSNSVEKMVAAAQMKAKPSSPKVLYLQEEEKEEARARKLGDFTFYTQESCFVSVSFNSKGQ